ncbi:MAG TPA: ribonuclease III [Candidatus Eremiobacteraceae bacterium]
MSESIGRRRALRAFGARLRLKVAAGDDWRLLDEALTHDSYTHESGRAKPDVRHRPASNERLEFLGDAVVGAAVADYLFRRHPSETEGELSRRRAALVSRAALGATALRWELGPLLLLGKGEAAAHGERRPSILAAAAEAVIGAVFLSEGFAAAAEFVAREHLAHADEGTDADPKTALQELLQGRFKRAPAYAVNAETGPAHARSFSISVFLGNDLLGTGAGPTKKLAEAAAAADALRALRR